MGNPLTESEALGLLSRLCAPQVPEFHADIPPSLVPLQRDEPTPRERRSFTDGLRQQWWER